MKRTISGGICVAIVVFMSVTSFAGYVDFKGMGLNSKVVFHCEGSPCDGRTVPAGQLDITYNGTDLMGYCVDVYQGAGDMNAEERGVESLRNGDYVAYLFETYSPVVNSGTEAAALQTAIWEVLNEQTRSFDVTRGSVWIGQNSRGKNVGALANQWLSTIPQDYTSNWSLLVLSSSARQDILTSRQVPEPATMFTLGLGSIMMLRAKRKKG